MGHGWRPEPKGDSATMGQLMQVHRVPYPATHNNGFRKEIRRGKSGGKSRRKYSH